MSDCILNPSRLTQEVIISKPALLFVNPGDTRSITSLARKLKAQQHPLFNSNLFEIPEYNSIFWAGPALGSPAAVIVLEKLIALGCRNIIVYGWCGSLVPQLCMQDIFLPTWSISEEGTSKHYPLEKPAASDPTIRKQLREFLQKKGYPVKEGPIWTTDAPYRETRNKIETYGQQGVMAADMEFSALCTVASFRGITLTSAMLVSDELYHEKWHSVFTHKSFHKKSRKVFACLSEFASSIIC